MIKKSTKNIKSTLFYIMFVVCLFNAQAQKRACGMVEHMQKQMQNPEYINQYKSIQEKFKAQLVKNLSNKSLKRAGSKILIPVAVHFPEGVESDRACLEALAQTQIDILNADFTGTNTDISSWSAAAPFYPGINTGAANFLFCIAKFNHPRNIDPEMLEGGPAVTIGYNYGNGTDTDPNWSGYMNFLIKNIGDDLLGFAPLGGNIAAGESVVMNTKAFGSGLGCPDSNIVPVAPFNLGRTVTHELGHFYNLDHTFGSCDTDDGIADTPNQDESNGGCPVLGDRPACDPSEQELFQNYMDYTDDKCMFMFSEGQANEAEAYVMSIASSFKAGVTQCLSDPDFFISAIDFEETLCNPTAAPLEYDLKYFAVGGNTDETTFTLSNLPSGITASINPTTLSASGDLILTLNNLDNVLEGNYTLTITATGINTKTTTVDLNIENSAPAAPSLISPANGEGNQIPLVELEWSTASNVTYYNVEIATDAAFTTNLISETVTNASFKTPELEITTDYFWRVKAVNSCGESPYSTINSFTTASINCTNYNSTENNINIPDSGDPSIFHEIISTISITDDTTISNLNVAVNIDHTWAEDIQLELTSPAGTSIVILASGICDDDNNDIAATFDDEASGPIVCNNSNPTISGTFQPTNPLSAFIGENSLGDWILTIIDAFPQEEGGTFLNYSIEICGADNNNALSVNESVLESTLSLWPNPSNGEVNVSFKASNSDDVSFNVYDLSGRLVNKQSFKNTPGIFNKTLQLDNLESSIYILSIENAGRIINKRIIIE